MEQPDHPSRRVAVRHKTLKQAKVVLRDWSTFDCVLRNLSDSGARLEFSDPVNLPDTFDLLVVSERVLWPCRRVWGIGTIVGILFTGPGRAAPPRKF